MQRESRKADPQRNWLSSVSGEEQRKVRCCSPFSEEADFTWLYLPRSCLQTPGLGLGGRGPLASAWEAEDPWPVPGTGTGALASTSSFILSVVGWGLTPEEVPGPPPQVWEGTFPQRHTLASACFLRLREPRLSARYPLRTGLSRGCTPPYTHTSLHRLVDTFACLDEMGSTSSLGLV